MSRTAPAAFLRKKLGAARVEPFTFTLPSKSRLGYNLLSFAVPIREGHDDYLMSLALCAHAAATTPPPPESRVIPPEEGYRPHTGEDWARVW